MKIRPPRGLVSVSLLKSFYDEKRDHLEMFMPFLLDAIRCYPSDDFSADQMVAHVKSHDGLKLPAATMDALLARARRSGFIRREGGWFLIDRAKLAGQDLTVARRQAEAEGQRLADALISFAKERSVEIPTNETAQGMIITFLEQNQIVLLLETGTVDDFEPIDGINDRESRVVARFILDRCLPDQDLARSLRGVLEGYVLQNALLLRDFSAAGKALDKLTVYLDTGVLFGLIGLQGKAAGLAVGEAIELLRSLNAKLAVFDCTVSEMRRILAVFENHLGTTDGQRTLRPREETRYLLTNRYTPSMVKEISALLPSKLEKLGVSIEEVPYRNRKYTLDEEDLTKRFLGPDQDPQEARIRNDIDCIAAILTFRAGRHSNSVDGARAVFSTSSGRVVRNATEWYKNAGEGGVPPVVHFSALTSIAWLKKPAAAQDLKLHELVALCTAALRPSPKVWARFVDYLDKAIASNDLDTDEAVAVLASSLTDASLSYVSEGSEDPDADTLTDVIDRVIADYRGDAAMKVAAVEMERDSERALRAETERLLDEQRLILQAHKAAIRARADKWAGGIAGVVYWGLAPVIIAAILASTFSLAQPGTRWGKNVLIIGLVVVAVLGIAGALWGTHLGAVRGWIREKVARRIESFLAGDPKMIA